VRHSQFLPQPFEDQRRANPNGLNCSCATLSVCFDDSGLLRETGTRTDQPVDLAGLLQQVQPSQRADHTLPNATIDALVFHNLQILILPGLLDSHKHAAILCQTTSANHDTTVI